jgi:hypothetical protein
MWSDVIVAPRVILELMWYEVIVDQQCGSTMPCLPIVAQQCVLKIIPVMQVAYPRRKKRDRQTDRHGRAHKVFFAHGEREE